VNGGFWSVEGVAACDTPVMARPVAVLLREARRALGMNQVALATLMFSGSRTVQRWEKGGSSPRDTQLQILARAVAPRNAALAAELYVWAPLPQGPPPPPAPRPMTHVLIDSVVCAGAEAIAVPPQALRPALGAALLRAQEAGLTLEDLLRALVPHPTG